jgi:hypothetical protein
MDMSDDKPQNSYVWREGHPPPDEKRMAVRFADGTWTVWDKMRDEGRDIAQLMRVYPGLVTHWSPIPEPALPAGSEDFERLAEVCRGR